MRHLQFRHFRLALALAPGLWTWAPASAGATEWFVAPGGAGPGTSAAPFGTIQDGLNAALPGDTVTVAPGTYVESLRTVRHGEHGMPIRVRAAQGRGSTVVTSPGRVLSAGHAYFVVDGLVLDGQYGAADTVVASSGANYLTLLNAEVRRSSRDLIDMQAPTGVLIENCLIHHALNAAGGRTDAHGKIGRASCRERVYVLV